MPTGKILASTFNLIQSKISTVVGAPSISVVDLGYNLAVASYPVTLNVSKIKGQDVNLIIQDVNLAIQHQTATPTSLQTFSPTQKILQGDLAPIASAVDTAYNNRNSAGVGQLSLVNSNSYSNGDDWSSSHSHSVRLDWGSNAQFRGWANLGGFVSIGLGMTGGSGSTQDTSWINLLASIGSIVIGPGATILENSSASPSQYTFPNFGIYNLLGPGQNGVNAAIAFKITDADTHYTGNKVTVYVRPFGGTGVFDSTGIDIQVELIDGHVAPANTTDDTVTAALGITTNVYYSFGKTPTATDLGNSIA